MERRASPPAELRNSFGVNVAHVTAGPLRFSSGQAFDCVRLSPLFAQDDNKFEGTGEDGRRSINDFRSAKTSRSKVFHELH